MDPVTFAYLLSNSCDMAKTEAYRCTGPVKEYDHLDYTCRKAGQCHYFCKKHHEQRNCPIHPTGYRKR